MSQRLKRRFRLGVRIALHLAAVAVSCAAAMGQAASRFDLTGPSISVHVQRGEQSLPIAMVPNLQAGDKLTIHADLPRTQSVRMILIVAFLRGSTNPPPDNWFTELKTWDKRFAEGVTVAVPQEAQQALIFLAPETGGDFSTLKSAVTGRPGTFVRASQDLNEASFEQARIERYMQALQRVSEGSSDQLLDHSKKLAATLNLKPNDDCFKKPADQQMACLRQTGTQLLLDDGHGQTLASALTSGDTANLIGAVAGTPMATANGAGMYSAYVGTVIDLVRLMSGIHTAHFQYIPAIAFPDEESLNLRLNTAPSFHNPKSVIVVALPAIQSSVAPPLRLQDVAHVSCLLQPRMVLPLEGAPLVYATSFAHDLHLHLNDGATLNGKTDLPLIADAFEGGLMLTEARGRKPLPVAAPEARDADASHEKPASQSAPDTTTTMPLIADKDGPMQITGTLQGMWGFDTFSGVTVPLQRLPGGGWTAAEQSDLFTGRENQLRLHADGTACASTIALDQGGHDSPLKWKQAADRKNVLQVSVPLEKAAPGSVHLLVKQFGTPDVEKVAVTAYSDKTRLEAIRIHAGDTAAMLAGTGLGGIVSVKIAGSDYKPSPDGPSADGKSLQLVREQGKQLADTHTKPVAFISGDSGTAEAKLADGRTLPVSYSVDTARPALDLLRKTLKADSGSGIPLTLSSEDAIPLNAKLTLALRSRFPERFPRSEKIEVALTDGSLKATLSLADGSVVLQDSHTALAFLTPAKTFGPSAFGPIQVRAVGNDGTTGDWIPLGTLVRTPVITGVTCTRATPKEDPNDPGCQINGKDLYLLGSVATDNSFQNETEVPLGFAGDSISVPRPADNHTLYLKLRDDPDVVSTVTAIVPPSPRRSATPASATTAPATTPPANGPQPDAAIPQAAATPGPAGAAQQ
ncbi:hypothetical protein SAMN05444167_2188 [Terriglobus roseus]|uniref:Uncharacterized protein n=1 Tax=Terriglobus roseus TaxID=392734 RepID=A0A1G7KHU0_9BACT|nr:hypothetical protein SAMN05444167_2188 [Terriglobus roseus]